MEREFQDSLLPNGIHLHTYVTDRFKTVLCKLYIHQPLGPKASATALLPFVLGRGCRTYPTLRDIARRLEELYGAIFSADVVKIGERQLIELGLSVPEEKVLGVSGLLGEAVQTLAEVVCHPLLEGEGFNQEYFRQERELLLRKIDGLINDKPRYAMLRLFQEMCPKEPFGIHKYGSREEIEGLTAASLFAHYQEIRQGQCDLFVVGNVSPSQVEEAVQGAFADGWRSREFPPVSEGTPQGGVISPLLCNIYLDAFDQKRMALGIRIVRYADDILILARHPRQAERYRDIAVRILEEDLKLVVNRQKTHITNVYRGVPILGFVIYPKHVSIHPKRKGSDSAAHPA